MADRKPPRPQAGERVTLLALLQYQRESVVRKVDGVSEDQARHRFVDSDTTLLWLVKHLTRAEHIWLVHRFDGVDEVLEDTVQPDDTLAGIVDGYRAIVFNAVAETNVHAGRLSFTTESAKPQYGQRNHHPQAAL